MTAITISYAIFSISIPPATTGILPATFSETRFAMAKRSSLLNWKQAEKSYTLVAAGTITRITLWCKASGSVGALTWNISLERHTVKMPETPDWMYHSVIARQPPTDNSIIITVAISSIIIIITLLANLATKSAYGRTMVANNGIAEGLATKLIATLNN